MQEVAGTVSVISGAVAAAHDGANGNYLDAGLDVAGVGFGAGSLSAEIRVGRLDSAALKELSSNEAVSGWLKTEGKQAGALSQRLAQVGGLLSALSYTASAFGTDIESVAAAADCDS